MDLQVHHDETAGKFVADLDGQEAFLSYSRVSEDTLDYRFTFVPPAHRGKDVGRQLVNHALNYAAQNGLRVIPSCWFVEKVMGAARRT